MWLIATPFLAIGVFFAVYYSAIGLWVATEDGNDTWYYPRCDPDILDGISEQPVGAFDLRDVVPLEFDSVRRLLPYDPLVEARNLGVWYWNIAGWIPEGRSMLIFVKDDSAVCALFESPDVPLLDLSDSGPTMGLKR